MRKKTRSRYTRHRLSRRQFLGLLLGGFLGGCASSRQSASSTGQTTSDSLQVGVFPTPSATQRATRPTPTPAAAQFSGEQALAHAAAQMEYVPRHPGTEGWRKCGDYILSQFAAQGWSAEEQPFTYMDTDCRNLIAKRGTGPLLILGAHYDSRRYADQDPDPQKRTQPVPAANDGASGVAVLIELARVLKPEELGRTIWLVAFDAEDNGGLDGWDWIAGSRHFVSVLQEPTQGMVLFDMIGDADQQIYYERNSDKDMNTAIWQVADELQYDSFIPKYRFSMLDDHIPFLEAGIAAVDLIDFDYPYWHTTADTLDKINAPSLEASGRTAETWLLQGAPGLPPIASVHMPLVMVRHGCQLRAAEYARRMEHRQPERRSGLKWNG